MKRAILLAITTFILVSMVWLASSTLKPQVVPGQAEYALKRGGPDLQMRNPNLPQSSTPRSPASMSQASLPQNQMRPLRPSDIKVLEDELVLDNGHKRVRKILHRDTFKYPKILSEEIYDHSGQLISRQEKVADHLKVQLKPGVDAQELEKVAANHNFKIRHYLPASNVYLLSFEVQSPEDLAEQKKKLQSENIFEWIDEDALIKSKPGKLQI